MWTFVNFQMQKKYVFVSRKPIKVSNYRLTAQVQPVKISENIEMTNNGVGADDDIFTVYEN